MADEEIVTEPNQTPPKNKKSTWGRAGVFFALFAILLSIATLSYSYFQLANINVSLAKMVTNLEAQANDMQHDLAGLQQSIAELQKAKQDAEGRTLAQNKIINEWQAAEHGNVEKWQIAEAQYLVKSADATLKFSHDTTNTLLLLQRANDVIKNSAVDNPTLMQIKEAIQKEITILQSQPQVDVEKLYLALNLLNKQIDQLPLITTPSASPSPAKEVNANLSWWQAGLARTLETLKQIVVIRRYGKEALPVVLPDEKIFLYQNLHAQLEQTKWAILNRNNAIYQMSLDNASDWIKQYFDNGAETTKQVLKNLADLRTINITLPELNLTDTLQLFDRYFSPTDVTQPAQ